MSIYTERFLKAGKKVALLIDPDKCSDSSLQIRLNLAAESGVDFIFVGGSLLNYFLIDGCIDRIKAQSTIPVVLFPANGMHLSGKADAILFMSLISGRNADLLIGNHIHSAPIIKKLGLEAIPTGYMIMESGQITTAQYISHSMPLPRSKPDVAVSTAIAGEMLGMKALYLDAGSGAEQPVPSAVIEAIKKNTGIPLIIGGGLRSKEAVGQAFDAGADVVVLGNAIEKEPRLLKDILHP